jgi:hypothetical protein
VGAHTSTDDIFRCQDTVGDSRFRRRRQSGAALVQKVQTVGSSKQSGRGLGRAVRQREAPQLEGPRGHVVITRQPYKTDNDLL